MLALQMNNKLSYAQNMNTYTQQKLLYPLTLAVPNKNTKEYENTYTHEQLSKNHTKHQRTLESANNKMIRDISLNYGREAYVRAESKLYGTDEKTRMLLIMRTLKGGRAALAY